MKENQRYQVIAYDKDNDTEIFLAGHPDYESAYSDATLMWKPLAKDEHIRNLHGRLDTNGRGEPFDWLVIKSPDGGETVIGFYD
ncbi:MAG: hypothetical protein NC311_13385 [Muribaculaceae bacterium]|nr:hypothetical protein [Muribaculaceae bacterium]